jgi:hypothetical protein
VRDKRRIARSNQGVRAREHLNPVRHYNPRKEEHYFLLIGHIRGDFMWNGASYTE